jgi:hypothetical protein
MKIILDLCGGTGSWARPYKENGFDVRTLTLPDFDVEKWQDDDEFVKLLHSNTVYGILAAPPCTMFSIARNDKTAIEPRDLRKGIKTVQACLDIIHECLYSPYHVSKNSLQFWALENPASGYLKRFLGTPPFIFDPSEYGDNHTKKTALWGMFNEPKKTTKAITLKGDENNYVKSVEKYFDEKRHLIPEGYREKTGLSMRTVVRSITPQGFAQAFYKANCG